MKKVLLIGCLNKTLQGIGDCLGDSYQVQLCSEKIDSVQNMVCLMKPDLIIISQIGMVAEDIPIFDLFEKRYLKVPMLIIALKELEGHFNSILLTDRKVEPIYRPVTKSKILESCEKLLKSDKITGIDGPEETRMNAGNKKNTGKDIQDSDDYTWKHIVVVDDSRLVLRNVKRLLEDRYQISIVESGEQAIALMKKRKVDLVLLDYEMPGWDGKKTLEEIRKDSELSDIPVIFLTGISEREHILSVLQLNPAGYLLKPTEGEKLIETIEKAFQHTHED